MNIAPLLAAPPAIQIHLGSTLLALVLGTIVLLGRPGTPLQKGGGLHKLLGRAYVGLMLLACLSSFFISEIFPGSLSPIHILSVITPTGLAAAIYAARRGNIRWHRRAMLMVYWSGLILTGFFTLLPNRLLGQMLFGA